MIKHQQYGLYHLSSRWTTKSWHSAIPVVSKLSIQYDMYHIRIPDSDYACYIKDEVIWIELKEKRFTCYRQERVKCTEMQ